jgi:hypothetical protein
MHASSALGKASLARLCRAAGAIPFTLFAYFPAQDISFDLSNTLERWWKDQATIGWTDPKVCLKPAFGRSFFSLQVACMEL